MQYDAFLTQYQIIHCVRCCDNEDLSYHHHHCYFEHFDEISNLDLSRTILYAPNNRDQSTAKLSNAQLKYKSRKLLSRFR